MTVHELKARLRSEARARRAARSEADRALASVAVTANLDQVIRDCGATAVAIFLSTPTEPETREAIRELSNAGIRFVAPVSREGGVMEWTPVDGTSPERPGLGGMPEPDVSVDSTAKTVVVDLVVCPAAAVDKTGTRLGWGGGFYDRFFAELSPETRVFALVFDDDVVSNLPREKHDVPVDGVITSSGWWRFESVAD